MFSKHVIKHRFCPTCGIHTHGEGTDPSGKAIAAINVRCLEGFDFKALPVNSSKPWETWHALVLGRFGEVDGADFVSPVWTFFFFAFRAAGVAPAGAGAQQLLRLADQAAVREIVAGRVSQSGQAYRRIAGLRLRHTP